ncbi:MAG: tRNA (cytidine(34)-2'-O)-methyltransferase [Oscillospiraceae bacterium]|nr:tRNA (cytidine(34)-2'-O)-methyltransferase [Oscillospiraceae bacterium]
MPHLHIVLAQPQIPQNTGNISRTCAVTGASLHLIRPYGFTITDRQLKRAGLDYWDKLEIFEYDSLEAFFTKHPGAQVYFFTTKSRTCFTDVLYPQDRDVYLMFGREDRGLPEELLMEHPETAVRIPMRPTLRSLNLSNSAAIAAYEVLRQWDFPDMACTGELHEHRWEP